MLKVSAFDQEFLGVPCFRVVSPLAATDFDRLKQEQAKGHLFADAKLPASAIEGSQQLLRAGFRKICEQAELEHDLHALPARSGGETAAIVARLDLSQSDIAAHAEHFIASRFRQDPLLAPDRCNRLYARWIQNSLSGGKQVAAIGRNFCTFSDLDRVRSIDLLSVLDKRKGHASSLLRTLVTDARDKNCTKVRVVTEVENAAALSVYRGVGFEYRQFFTCFHLKA